VDVDVDLAMEVFGAHRTREARTPEFGGYVRAKLPSSQALRGRGVSGQWLAGLEVIVGERGKYVESLGLQWDTNGHLLAITVTSGVKSSQGQRLASRKDHGAWSMGVERGAWSKGERQAARGLRHGA
jgi:hypothetical protein